MILNIFIKYLEWYYLDKTIEILKGWKKYIVVYFNYFSIPTVIKTLFSPWKRITSGYGRGFDIKVFIETFIFNLMSRIIGFVIRIFFLMFSFLFQFFVLIIGFFIVIIWLVLPFIFFIAIYYSFYLIT